jgi:hypothetical protein
MTNMGDMGNMGAALASAGIVALPDRVDLPSIDERLGEVEQDGAGRWRFLEKPGTVDEARFPDMV